jgi:hypothetical protein
MENSRIRGSGVILLLFALSGMAALIYEIVWYQLLQLAIGATAISLAFCWPASWAACAWGPACSRG